jgi:hypothetical protein
VVDTNIFASEALKSASWPASVVRWIDDCSPTNHFRVTGNALGRFTLSGQSRLDDDDAGRRTETVHGQQSDDQFPHG